MAERNARTHTNKSNRARDNLERKAVFKSVLDNPFQLGWPPVPENVQNAVLAGIISALDGVADICHEARHKSRKRKRAENKEEMAKTVKRAAGKESAHETPAPETNVTVAEDVAQDDIVLDELNKPSSRFDHLTFGINEVTKLLESHAQRQRSHAPITTPASIPFQPPSSKLVAVCLKDINPPALVGHLPNLVAACNSVRGVSSRVWLVALPKGAEESLAAAAGLKRVAAIAIDESAPQFHTLQPLLESVSLISAPWLTPVTELGRTMIPTHIKQMKTSAPKDMRAAKERRGAAKTAAKQQRKGKVAKRVTITA